MVLDKLHGWTPRAIVEQRVDVETYEQFGVLDREQLIAGEAGRAAGVHKAGHRLHEDRSVKGRQVTRQFVQLGCLGHRVTPSGRVMRTTVSRSGFGTTAGVQ